MDVSEDTVLLHRTTHYTSIPDRFSTCEGIYALHCSIFDGTPVLK